MLLEIKYKKLKRILIQLVPQKNCSRLYLVYLKYKILKNTIYRHVKN